jgi:hypothetical protein
LQQTVTDTDDEFNQYIRLRLVSAYALNNQDASAISLLEELVGETPTTTLMDTMINSAYAAYYESRNPIALCASLYQSLRDYDFWSTDSQILEFGQINDYGVPFNYGGGDGSPTTSGCNLPGLLMSHAQRLEVGDQTPETQLRVQGWQIEQSFHDDLNDDGVDEWLIWIDVFDNQALVLASSNSGYRASMQFLTPPDNLTTYGVHQLSSDGQQFLVTLTERSDDSCPHPEQAGLMTLYRIQDFSLMTDDYYYFCESRTLDTIFSDPQTFSAWELPMGSNCHDQLRSEVTYTWNENEAQFVRSTPLSCNMDDTPDDQNLFSCGLTGESFCGYYLENQEALDAIEAVLAQPPEFADDDFLLTVHYWRGLRLEALGRRDEALAEYIGIYEDAPESTWGALAALHFEAKASTP